MKHLFTIAAFRKNCLWILPILVFSWISPLHQQARKETSAYVEIATDCLELLGGLSLAAEAMSSSRIPFISGVFSAANRTLDENKHYLSYAAAAILLNDLLVKLLNHHLVMLVIGLIWILSWIQLNSKFWWRMLLLAIFINPGFSIFITSVHAMDKAIGITSKDALHQALTNIHHDYQEKEKARLKKVEARKKKQLTRDREKGRDHLTGLQKLADGSEAVVSEAGLHLAEDFKLTVKSIQLAAKKLPSMIISFFVGMLLICHFFPAMYVLSIYHLFKKL